MKQKLFRLLYKLAVGMKKMTSPFIPAAVMQQVKRKLLKSAFPIEKVNVNFISGINHSETIGINLVGYARAEMGIGESCRIAAKSLATSEIPFGIINFKGTNSARMSDTTWIHKEMNEPIYSVNVFHINAEQMIEVFSIYREEIFRDKYNIGYWHWELSDFPDRWLESMNLVNEIWAPSQFVAEAIALKSPVPVIRIPHSIEVKIEQIRDRQYFQLSDQPFLFLTMYDVRSYKERKNPQASIIAFKLAFKFNDKQVGLVVKVNCSSSDTKELNQLQELIGNYTNIYLVKETLTRNDTNALIDVTDCFISLHRSEGFGLGLAEAMYLGKPVIGTNWSSNTDFMNNNNSCLVNYKLIQLDESYGPYEAYQQWAEPDVTHAAQYMVKVVSDIEYRNEIARQGELTIKRDFSPQSVGKLVEKRLKYIKYWNFGG